MSTAVLAPPDAASGSATAQPAGLPPDRPADPAPAAAPLARRRRWPVALAMVGIAAGVLTAALAGYLARTGHRGDGSLLFWAGLALVVLPAAAAALRPSTTRGERATLVLAASVGMVVARYAIWPEFSSHDSLLHSVTLSAIHRSGDLFGPNPLLPVSPLYPGLELVTNTASSLSGLTLLAAAIGVLVVCRVVVAATVFLLAERATGSSRAGAMAALVFACNPQFLIFNSAFAYESLAVPLAGLAVLGAARAVDGDRRAWLAVSAGAVGALVVTHHLTTLVLVGFCAAVGALAMVWRSRRSEARPFLAVAALAAVLGVGWMLGVARAVVGYLDPILRGAWQEVTRLVGGGGGERRLFQSYGGEVTPPWERGVMLASIAILALAVLVAAVAAWRSRRTHTALFAVLAVVALVFPALPFARFVPTAAELAERASTFVFIGVGVLVGWWVDRALVRREQRVGRTGNPWRTARGSVAAVVVLLGVVQMGQTALGTSPSLRLPGPYLPAADARSVDPHGRTAAAWAAANLPPGTRVVSDRVNRLLLAYLGHLTAVTNLDDQVQTAPILLGPTVDDEIVAALREGRVDVVAVDRRLADALPLYGVYVEEGEPDALTYQTPVAASALAKFDTTPGAVRLYDDGTIALYDVRALWGASDLPAATDPPVTRSGPGLPLRLAAIAVALTLVLLAAAATGQLLGQRLDGMTRVALVAGTALTSTVLSALVLGLALIPLRPASLAAGLAVPLAVAVVARWRARRAEAADAPALPRTDRRAWPRPALALGALGAAAVALAAFVIAVEGGRRSAPAIVTLARPAPDTSSQPTVTLTNHTDSACTFTVTVADGPPRAVTVPAHDAVALGETGGAVTAVPEAPCPAVPLRVGPAR